MALPQIFSRRRRQDAGKLIPDIYEYNVMPSNVRVQLIMIIDQAVLNLRLMEETERKIYAVICDSIKEEKGVFSLSKRSGRFYERAEFQDWFQSETEIDYLMDALEIWYEALHTPGLYSRPLQPNSHFIDRLNARLLEGGLGYELIDGKIIEKSNEFIHTQAVLPALHILSEGRFSNANVEFHAALEAYKNEELEDSLTDCLKAFESVMKVIIDEQGWTVPDNATSKVLINKLFDEGYVPAYMQSQFTGIRTMLESSVPTTRNRSAAHGQGTKSRKVPKSLAAFQIHQTASIVVFLAALHR